MCTDEASEQLKGHLLLFENALIFVNDIAFEMNIEPKFHEKCIRHGKRQFDENIENEIVKYLQKSFRVDYFLYIIDKNNYHTSKKI